MEFLHRCHSPTAFTLSVLSWVPNKQNFWLIFTQYLPQLFVTNLFQMYVFSEMIIFSQTPISLPFRSMDHNFQFCRSCASFLILKKKFTVLFIFLTTFTDFFFFFLKHYVWTCPFHSKSSPTLASNLLMKLHERSLQIVILAVFTNFYIYSPFLCICPLSSVLSVTETLREKLWCLVTSCTIQSI